MKHKIRTGSTYDLALRKLTELYLDLANIDQTRKDKRSEIASQRLHCAELRETQGQKTLQ